MIQAAPGVAQNFAVALAQHSMGVVVPVVVGKLIRADKKKVIVTTVAVYAVSMTISKIANPKIEEYGVYLIQMRREIAREDWSNGNFVHRHAPDPEPFEYGRKFLINSAGIKTHNALAPLGEFFLGSIVKMLTGGTPFKQDTRTVRGRVRFDMVKDELAYRQKRGIRMRSPERQ